MKLRDFANALLPSFTKSQLIDDLTAIRKELKECIIPPYTTATQVFGKRKFKDEKVAEFEELFDKKVKTKFRGNIYGVTEQVLKRMLGNIDTLERLVEAHYADDVMKDATTYLQLNLVQYIETMTFVSRYARGMLAWSLILESAAMGSSDSVEASITKAEVEWLYAQRNNFFTALVIMSGDQKELQDNFNEIPDITVAQESIDAVLATVGLDRLDPFSFGLIPVWLNPIYHIRMKVAEWQVARINAAKEEKKVLEMRIMHLKNLDAGKPDASLQKQIEYNEDRLMRLNQKLKEYEEEYA